MFLNQYHHSFDDKGRLTIPAKFRDQTVDGIAVVPGLDRDLMVLPKAEFDKLTERLDALNLTDPDARLLKEIILGNALEVTPDGSGRILLSPNLREFAELKDEVVFVGVGKNFEIWSAELWQKRQGELTSDVNAKRFAMLNI
ncbi:MAG TPA: division/cell wall cluster transcriptional repressor MraZ [Anaerolineales bacterium]|nr:division/cell wall cluster transcriptional repressor MraZ [Anaerolineales bacterium]